MTAALCREAGELAQRHGLRGYDRVRFPTIAWRVRRAVLFGRPGPAASTTDDEADGWAHAFRRSEKWGEQVAFEMIDREEWFTAGDGETFRGGRANHE